MNVSGLFYQLLLEYSIFILCWMESNILNSSNFFWLVYVTEILILYFFLCHSRSSPPGYPITTSGLRNPYPSSLSSLSRFSPPGMLPHPGMHPGLNHPAIITPGPKQEINSQENHRSVCPVTLLCLSAILSVYLSVSVSLTVCLFLSLGLSLFYSLGNLATVLLLTNINQNRFSPLVVCPVIRCLSLMRFWCLFVSKKVANNAVR